MPTKIVDVSRGERIAMFNTLAIETSARCNRSCVFCPVHGNERPDEYLPLGSIVKMLDELARLRWHGRLTNYIYNEPTMDPRHLSLISLFRHTIPRVCIMTSTNGDRLRGPDDIEALFDAGVNQLLINVYSASDGHTDPARVEHGARLAKRRYDLIEQWIESIGVKRGSVYQHAPPDSRVIKLERKWNIESSAKNLASYELQNRSGNIPWFQPPLEEPLSRGCVRPFRFLNVNWRGDGVLCCNDYHAEVSLGNIRDTSLVEMWNSGLLHYYRSRLQQKSREGLKLCATCDYRGGLYPHMIQHVTGVKGVEECVS